MKRFFVYGFLLFLILLCSYALNPDLFSSFKDSKIHYAFDERNINLDEFYADAPGIYIEWIGAQTAPVPVGLISSKRLTVEKANRLMSEPVCFSQNVFSEQKILKMINKISPILISGKNTEWGSGEAVYEIYINLKRGVFIYPVNLKMGNQLIKLMTSVDEGVLRLNEGEQLLVPLKNRGK